MYGLDYGTSNIVVAQERDDSTVLVPLEEGKPTIPSVLFIDREGAAVGNLAISNYQEALLEHVNAKDYDKVFRFFQGLKMALKDPNFTGTSLLGDPEKFIMGNFLTSEMLLGWLLTLVADQAGISGSDSQEVVIGRPVRISDVPEGDKVYSDRLRTACQFAGFKDIHFVYEPVAATVDLIGQTEGNVVVFDFGGGTLDVTLSYLKGEELRILANGGLPIGGFTLNEDLAREVVTPFFGNGAEFTSGLGKKSFTVPSWLMKQVTTFHPLPTPEVRRIRQTVLDILSENRDNKMLRGLWEYLDRGMVYSLFEELDRVKIELSTKDESTIHYEVGNDIQIRKVVTRADFESYIGERVHQARSLVESVLESAGITAAEVQHVVRVGGSSQIPAFQRMLEDLFPGRVEGGETFTSIAHGLTRAHRMGHSNS